MAMLCWVTVRGADPAMARRMVQMGMVLTIDTLGKKREAPRSSPHCRRTMSTPVARVRPKEGEEEGAHRPGTT